MIMNATFSLKFAKYWMIAYMSFINNSTRLTGLLGKALVVLFRIWIFVQLYEMTYRAANTTNIGGLTVAMTIWVLALTQSLQMAQSRRPNLASSIGLEVKSGQIGHSLIKPYSYMLFHFFSFLGRSLVEAFTNIFLAGMIALILVGPIDVTWEGLLMGIILLSLGFVMKFFVLFIAGILAFWIEEIEPVLWILSKAELIFGGVILPLSLFPPGLKLIAEYSPFGQFFFSGAQVLVQPSFALFQHYLVIQICWIVIFTFASQLIFNKSKREVALNGG